MGRENSVKTTLALVALLVLSAGALQAQNLTGAGATFPYPIYSKWFSEYSAAHPGVKISYRAIGSGAGLRQVATGLVDFGATDGPATDEQLAAARIKLIHIPTVMGAVAPIFNLPGIANLRFGPDVLAGIFLGKITKWNDERIARDNPDAKLPDRSIVVVHRSDASGTSYIFTDYLGKVSAAWANGPGRGTAPSWPVGMGAKGNEGVARKVQETPGAIGYVELIYALQNKASFGEVKNASGKWVKASIAGVTAAAATISTLPNDYRVSITNAPGEDAYPISSFTWLLAPVRSPDAAKGKVLKELLEWILTSGQSEAAALSYAPLPDAVAKKVMETVRGLR
jgi:phosphate transport system substrate-binding protein